MTDSRHFRLVAALLCVLVLGAVAPAASSEVEDTEEIKEAREEREEARRVVQHEAARGALAEAARFAEGLRDAGFRIRGVLCDRFAEHSSAADPDAV